MTLQSAITKFCCDVASHLAKHAWRGNTLADRIVPKGLCEQLWLGLQFLHGTWPAPNVDAPHQLDASAYGRGAKKFANWETCMAAACKAFKFQNRLSRLMHVQHN